MKQKILGLDLGTNSIGWAVVNAENTDKGLKPVSILQAGSRIIPMDAKEMSDFENGRSISQTHERTQARGTRRLYERRALRRERLNRVLSLMGFLPEHYAKHLNRYGQLIKGHEPKLAWCPDEDGRVQFLFHSSFNEMLEEFYAVHPEFRDGHKKIPYDWTVYYLRKKALTQAISKEELAWLLMVFNQKRGYEKVRGHDEELQEDKHQEYLVLKVVDVENVGKNQHKITLENGWEYVSKEKFAYKWKGLTKEFIVTTTVDEAGEPVLDKEGNTKRTFRAPDENDWGLLKIKTEKQIAESGKTTGEFIYDTLINELDTKVLGRLVRVVERELYKGELIQILNTQKQFITELQDATLFASCVEALYPNNPTHRDMLLKQDLVYLFVEDILFYQRPLKSKKSSINECPYEYVKIKKNGKEVISYHKCITKSHPMYEEYRAWDFLSNLHIYNGAQMQDVTAEYVKDKAALVKWLLNRVEITQEALLKHLVEAKQKLSLSKVNAKTVKLEIDEQQLSWNYPADKTLPMGSVTSRLMKIMLGHISSPKNVDKEALSDLLYAQYLEPLWHIMYSISIPKELELALKRFVRRATRAEIPISFDEEMVEKLKKVKAFEKQYGAYSHRALKKLLMLMRCGEFWTLDKIDRSVSEKDRKWEIQVLNRVEKIMTGEEDANVSNWVREKCKEMHELSDFQGLPKWLAEGIIYDQGNKEKWNTPEDIDRYIQHFRLHSLNNPVVEKVVLETLRVVRDIWKKHGSIDEIHVELGRDLKNPAEKRAAMQQQMQENEQAMLRAKYLLQEMKKPELAGELELEFVKENSPSHLERFRIYESNVIDQAILNKDSEYLEKHKKTSDAIKSGNKDKWPSTEDVKKYLLWMKQKYRSPYTGNIIPLGKLFTDAYQRDHIIPQSRYFDDSMSNKVICEAEVNLLKGNMLGLEFIKKYGGTLVTLNGGKKVWIKKEEEYRSLISECFEKDKRKKEILLLEDIPETFIARQLNDSRYISKLVKKLLSNIVREYNVETNELEKEDTSKHVIVCTGKTTDYLKQDWEANDVWNRIILPRFERMNELYQTNEFTAQTDEGHTIPSMPLDNQKSFSKKRIDHRHHAMDAIVIACTTRNHVSLLSNEASLPENTQTRIVLSKVLREVKHYKDKEGKPQKKKVFIKPWPTFTQDMETALNDIVVSFKQNLRVVNNSTNYTTKRNAKGEKETNVQKNNLVVRKSLHKASIHGLVNLQMIKKVKLQVAITNPDRIVEKDLREKIKSLLAENLNEKQIRTYFKEHQDVWHEVDLNRIAVLYYTNETPDRYFAKREKLGSSFNAASIDKITDSGIREILRRHLALCSNKPEEAFSPEGIERMNQNILALNNGKPHKPIYSVRKYESSNKKFTIGQTGVKTRQYVEAADGTCLYFAIYRHIVNGEEKRYCYTIPLQVVMECQQKNGKKWKNELDLWIRANHHIENATELYAMLSPGDLVYMPTREEVATGVLSWNKNNIYKVVSFKEAYCYFVPHYVASPLINKCEYTTDNKTPREGLIRPTDRMIKDYCIPLKINRLGEITIV